MAVKRGRAQARRSSGSHNGLPGWAWLIVGVLITLGVVLAAPRFLRSSGEDGFFRPRPNPDARPARISIDADAEAESAAANDVEQAADKASENAAPEATQFDFYTLLPGKEVAMTDAELAASAREEEAHPPPPSIGIESPTDAATTSTLPGTSASATPNTAARYTLQAGSFSASGDAEAVKARIALLGLRARVESAEINGKTVYRVRMGPYGTATELADAKAKLGQGGLPAMAIKAQ